MKLSTFSGLAAGSMMGIAIGASMMMMPQSKKMKRAINKSSSMVKKQMMDMMGK